MPQILVALVSGILFGLGLAVSRMIDPAKVLGFLDIAGAWDPSLILVMGGAIIVALPGYRLVLGRSAPGLAERFHLPSSSAIDARLVGGAALFGAGWGLVGFCPGPAIAALSLADVRVLVFVLAMVAGMGVFVLIDRLRAGGGTAQAGQTS